MSARVHYTNKGAGFLYIGLVDGRSDRMNVTRDLELLEAPGKDCESRFCLLLSDGAHDWYGAHDSHGDDESGWLPEPTGFMIRAGDTVDVVYDESAGIVRFCLNDAQSSSFSGFQNLSPCLVCSQGFRGESARLVDI